MSRTELAYAATCLRAYYAMPGTEPACMLLYPTRCPDTVLSEAMSGTDIAYAASRRDRDRAESSQLPGAYGASCLRARYAMSGTGVAYAASILLRARYAMSSTDLVQNTIGLRAPDAMSGTDLAHAATRISLNWTLPQHRVRFLLSAYARAMPCPFLSELLRDKQYRPSIWSYAAPGTDLAYSATRCPVLTYSVWSAEEWTEIAAPNQAAPLSAYAQLRHVRLWCYAKFGTDIAYGVPLSAYAPRLHSVWYRDEVSMLTVRIVLRPTPRALAAFVAYKDELYLWGTIPLLYFDMALRSCYGVSGTD
eukprot:3771256-Rhodomonas_salina.2